MKQTEQFIEALSEWNERFAGEARVTQVEGIVRFLLYSLGGYEELEYGKSGETPGKTLEDLKHRMETLIKEHNLREDFLVMSCVRGVTEFLDGLIKEHGELIISNETVLGYVESQAKIRPDFIQAKLQKLKDPSYIAQAHSEFYYWQRLVIRKFNVLERKNWDADRMVKNSVEFHRERDRIPKNILELFKDIPIGKIREKTGSIFLSDLTYEEAVKLREEIINQDS